MQKMLLITAMLGGVYVAVRFGADRPGCACTTKSGAMHDRVSSEEKKNRFRMFLKTKLGKTF